MKAIAAVITTMRAKGMSDSDILDVVEAMTAVKEDGRSAGAVRTARWRANKAESVTSDVTVTSHPSPLCPPLSLPQTPTQAPPISPQPTMSGKPDPVPVKAKSKDYAPAFLLLWDTFPKHPNASKLDAFKSWTKLSQQDQDLCLDGAVRYIDFLERERRRRPDYPQLHLATFINSRRWESLLEDAA